MAERRRRLPRPLRFVLIFTALVIGYFSLQDEGPRPRPVPSPPPTEGGIAAIRANVTPRLESLLDEQALTLGAPVFIRIFKEERLLEVWVENGGRYDLFKTYEICNYSGVLGPKLKEGDRQSPEGFYRVGISALNPNSRFHLSFNLGYPNRFDRAHRRTGSYLMVHGACASIGCYAMRDGNIEEIYLMVEAALTAGQKQVPVHAFPFRMSDTRLAREKDHRWYGFWQNLKTGYDLFERTGHPPAVRVEGQHYRFEAVRS